MGDVTKIQWTDSTFNPWIGCTKVSAGCTNCYADAQDHRWGHDRWGPGKPRTRTTPANWRKPLQWDEAAREMGRRHRVFCASMCDVFDREVSDVWRVELFDLIRRTPNLDWQLLTKRPENIIQSLSAAIDAYVRAPEATMETADMLQAWVDGRPPPNVWLGTSVEDQAAADKRIPELLRVPAVVRFLSCEPLIGPVSLVEIMARHGSPDIHWMIVGGESGPKSRPMEIGWARSLLFQAAKLRIAPFVKQLGAKPVDVQTVLDMGDVVRPVLLADKKGGDMSEWPRDLQARTFPGWP